MAIEAGQYLGDLAEWKCLAQQGFDAFKFSPGVIYENDKGKGAILVLVSAHICFIRAAVNGVKTLEKSEASSPKF